MWQRQQNKSHFRLAAAAAALAKWAPAAAAAYVRPSPLPSLPASLQPLSACNIFQVHWTRCRRFVTVTEGAASWLLLLRDPSLCRPTDRPTDRRPDEGGREEAGRKGERTNEPTKEGPPAAPEDDGLVARHRRRPASEKKRERERERMELRKYE